jgi:hypothetical protein
VAEGDSGDIMLLTLHGVSHASPPVHSLVPFALAVLESFGDVGGVDEVGVFEVGDGADQTRVWWSPPRDRSVANAIEEEVKGESWRGKPGSAKRRSER